MIARRGVAAVITVAAVAYGVAGCSTASTGAGAGAHTGPGAVLSVAASINAWGSILAQLGGTHVHETSIITNPATDPHVYEPTPGDGRTIADSRLFLENGIGYDPWAAKALASSPDSSRVVLNVGDLLAIPAGGNPHRWYSPANVETVADTITNDLKRLDPASAGYFDSQRQVFENTGLAEYHHLMNAIRASYAGTPVGASESIFAPMSDALGLNLLTPASFLKAISEGTDPSAADKAAIDAQIAQKRIKVYVVNTQNSTPDVAAQASAARKQGIAVTGVTETLSPANTSFQAWQVTQLTALQVALKQATGR
ncbi:MAG: zinc ABC transporter substrate-binding protein [Actinomycetota bacterium]|nr:zinc ABC transporter substrate-binding protein [Actinomycetota bacterium]